MVTNKNKSWTIDRLPGWFRWLALIPSSLLVLFLSETIISAIVKVIVTGDNGYGEITEEPEGIRIGRYFGSFFGAVACTAWINYASPNKRSWVVWLAAGIFVMANVISISDDWDMLRNGYYFLTIKYVLSALGSIFGCLIVMATK